MKSLQISRLALVILLIVAAVILVGRQSETASKTVVENEGAKIFIVDQTGERWDITQAVSIGFDPRYFEFGIGRNAFRPLGENDWLDTPEDKDARIRVLGIAGNGDAHAYSVAKLGGHETANTRLGSQPIVAAY